MSRTLTKGMVVRCDPIGGGKYPAKTYVVYRRRATKRGLSFSLRRVANDGVGGTELTAEMDLTMVGTDVPDGWEVVE